MAPHLTSGISSESGTRGRVPAERVSGFAARRPGTLASPLVFAALFALAACSPAQDCAATSSCPVVVQATVTQVVVTNALDTINVGATVLKSGSPRDATGAVVANQTVLIRWSSSAPAVARVDSLTGLVTGLSVGFATITGRAANGVTGTGSVLVKASGVVASISISPPNATVQVGRQLTLVGAAKDASLANVAAVFRWSSSNTSIVTIDSITGVVTGKGAGAATITVGTAPASVTANTSVSVVASTSLVATLPQVLLTTTYVAPTGTQRPVAIGGDFQAALNAAQPGDEILLAPGGVYTGNFSIPAKSGSGVIHVRTNVPYASLPPEGTRMTPTLAASLNLAKIQSSNGNTVMQTATGASNYRFIGVEVTVGSPLDLNSLIRAGDVYQTTLTSVSTNLVFDRMYLHGTTTNNLLRAFILSSTNTAVIDSWIDDVHHIGADAQAIVGWNGPGPYKIVNNHLAGSGENIMFGGADPTVSLLVPSDIEIRGNYFNKPAVWKTGANVWLVKNLFELKFAQRVLIEGNVFSGSWQSGQAGYAMNLKSSSGACPWCETKDVTIRYNYFTNAGAGIGVAGAPDPFKPDSTARRIVIQDNIVDNINVGIYIGASAFMQVLDAASDIIIDHNTFVSSSPLTTSVTMATPVVTGLTFTNNILSNSTFGFKGSGLAEGTATLNGAAPGAVFLKNVLIGATAGVYPAGNFFPANVAAVGFTNVAGFNYLLTGASAFKNAGTDGRDIGADVSVVASKIANVIVPP